MHNSIHSHARRSNVNDYPKDYGSSNISSNSELLGPVFTTRFPGCATHQSQSNGLNATIDQWDRHSDYLHLLHIRSISSMYTQIGANLLATWEKGGLHCIESLKIDTTAEDKLMMQVFTIFFPFSQPVFIASSFLMKESMPYSNNQSMTVNLIKE